MQTNTKLYGQTAVMDTQMQHSGNIDLSDKLNLNVGFGVRKIILG